MERIWHAFWLPRSHQEGGLSGGLFLWGEALRGRSAVVPPQPPYPDRPPKLRTDRERGNAPQTPSSTLLEPQAIVLDLKSFDFDPPTEERKTVSLPTRHGQRMLMTQCFSDSTGAEYTLSNHTIPGLFLTPIEAVNLLSSFPEELPGGLRLADSVRYWSEATKYLLDLLSRGRFLPSLRRNGELFEARWELILTDPHDEERFAVLADGLPPVCLGAGMALTSAGLLRSFLEVAGDALIRSFTSHLDVGGELRSEISSAKLNPALRWLEALILPDGQVNAAAYELLTLEQRLEKWISRFHQQDRTVPLRLHFELLSQLPEGSAEAAWPLRISVEHTGGEMGRREIDQMNTPFLRPFPVEEFELQLLHELGRAAALFPPFRRSLSGLRPTHLVLDTEEAYRFLKEGADALRGAGFGVTVPRWWCDGAASVGLHLSVAFRPRESNSHRGTLALSELLNFSWSIALGDRTVSVEEFREIASKGSPLIRSGERWIEIDPLKAAKTLKFIEEEERKSGLTVIEAIRLGLGGALPDSLFPVIGFHAEGWIEKFIERNAELSREVTQPPSFNGTLRPYQLEGLGWLRFLSEVGLGGCLADDMGLGKTIQFLALLLSERTPVEARARVAPTLLIVPMSILENWIRETRRFAPSLRTLLYHGPVRPVGEAFVREATQSDLVITTYSLAARSEELFGRVEWGRIALDEAQNIKNLATKQTRAIRRLLEKQLESGTACHRLALTGTPLENHLEELWSIFDFLNPGYLGTLSNFRRQFTIPIERYRDSAAQSRLAKLIYPFVLRRLKHDPKIIDDLPEKIEVEEFAFLSPEQALLYERVLEEMLRCIDAAVGVHRKGLVLATMTKLKQVCDHPALLLKDDGPLAGRSGKLTRLTELLETSIEEGDKILIFTQYAQMGELLKRYLEERFSQEVPFLHGSLPQGMRMKLVDKFQSDEAVRMFVLSLKAGGLGLNLTAANHVVHYDQWWNPAVEQQATDRAHRIGQKRAVQVRKLISKGTLEEKIAELLSRKRELAENIVGATRNEITEMSVEELRSLLSLSPRSFEFSDFQD